jgi:phosphoserine phosphatase
VKSDDLDSADALIAALEARGPLRGFAAFDADHTLWHADLGDLAFNVGLTEKLFRREAAEPMARAVEKFGGQATGDVHRDAAALYALYKRDKVDETTIVIAMTFCWAGYAEDELRGLARRLVEEEIAPARYEGIDRVARALVERGLALLVVTGSPKLLVEEGVRGWLELEPGRDVLGIQLETVSGRLGTSVREPVTYHEGKVRAVLARTSGAPPAVAFGDSKGDVPLLESATAARVAVHPRPTMRRAAREGGWLVFAPPRTVGGHAARAPGVDRVIE